jgi:hypothetical protein
MSIGTNASVRRQHKIAFSLPGSLGFGLRLLRRFVGIRLNGDDQALSRYEIRLHGEALRNVAGINDVRGARCLANAAVGIFVASAAGASHKMISRGKR